MDIDLLWTLGGWLFLVNFDCMASSHLLFFLAVIFIHLLLVHSSDPSKSLKEANKLSTHTTSLFVVPVPATTDSSSSSSSSSSSAPAVSSATKMKKYLHHTKTQDSRKSSTSTTSSSSTRSREFEAAKHEVPSGPNPISN